MGWLHTILGHSTNPHFAKRFWTKVKAGKSADCWEWQAFISPKGYGQFQVRKSRPAPAHRVAYVLARGDIKDADLICHTCDNRKCCNPNHLYLGTPKSNMDDMIARGRAYHPPMHGEKIGTAKLTESDVLKIRELHPSVSLRELAKQYKVDYTNISNIIRRKTWKHIN